MRNSIADPYYFDTDPDTGSEKFVSDPDPDRTLIRIQAKTIQIRIQTNKDSVPGKSFDKKAHIPCFVYLYILLIYHFSTNNDRLKN